MSGVGLSLRGVFSVGQSWQDVTASRALATVYTNTTGQPIFISVSSTATGSNALGTILVDGVQVERNQSAGGTLNGASVQAVIPHGSSYQVTTNGGFAIGSWMEFRR